MGRKVMVFLAAVLTVGAVLGRAAESLRILPLVRDDSVIVSLELADAYTSEVREAISSGLRTTFTYDVDLRMIVPAWVDRTVATAVVSTSDQYDNLTRRHSLSRSVNGRVEESLVTEDEAVVRRWLTSLSAVSICPTSRLDPSRDYYVRIRASARPHGASLLGWANAVTGQARFRLAR